MALIIGINLDNGVVDYTSGPINPQSIGGIADGDGDTGHVEPQPIQEESQD